MLWQTFSMGFPIPSLPFRAFSAFLLPFYASLSNRWMPFSIFPPVFCFRKTLLFFKKQL